VRGKKTSDFVQLLRRLGDQSPVRDGSTEHTPELRRTQDRPAFLVRPRFNTLPKSLIRSKGRRRGEQRARALVGRDIISVALLSFVKLYGNRADASQVDEKAKNQGARQ
jgi:hypothetical protein